MGALILLNATDAKRQASMSHVVKPTDVPHIKPKLTNTPGLLYPSIRRAVNFSPSMSSFFLMHSAFD